MLQSSVVSTKIKEDLLNPQEMVAELTVGDAAHVRSQAEQT
jgi:hypothetical protein